MAEKLADNNNIYITDISELNVDKTNALRRDCFNKDVELVVVKNTLLRKAMEKTNKEFDDLYQVLKGPTSLMFSDINNLPAKIIKAFRANSKTYFKRCIC